MADKIRIITNNVPRDLLNPWELTAKEIAEWEVKEDDERQFFRYKGNCHCLSDYQTTRSGPCTHSLPKEFEAWDGYADDSFFSGTLIKFVGDDFERVIVGLYLS